MPNFLRGLGQAIGVAGAGIGGYAKDEEERKRQALIAAQEGRAAEQLRLQQAAQKMAMERDSRDAIQQALTNRTSLRDKGYRVAKPPVATGSPLDAPFQQIADAQAAGDKEVVGEETFLAPLENPLQRSTRERGEDIQTRQDEIKGNQAFTAKENRLTREAQAARDSDREDWISGGIDPKTGQPVLYNKRTGETKQGGGVKQAGAGMLGGERSGIAAAFLGRLNIGKSDFDNAMAFVRDFHDKLKRGEIEITPWMMSQAAAANTQPNTEAHGAWGAASNAAGGMMSGLANKNLARTAKDYVRYMNLIRGMSTAITEVMPRPNQALLGIEQGLTMAKAGDPSERIDDIQHRLDKVYETMFEDPSRIFRKTEPTTTTTPATTNGVPTYEEWLAAQRKP